MRIMRETLEQSKNGTALYERVSFDSLTVEEFNKLIIPANSSVSDYSNFYVYHNKRNELLRVVVGDFSKQKNKQIEEERNKPTILDYCIAFLPSSTKISKRQRKTAQSKF